MNSLQCRLGFVLQVIGPGYRLSFDVTSLFTSIPHELSLSCVESSLDSDDGFLDRTIISKNNFLQLVKFHTECNTFQFNNQRYK